MGTVERKTMRAFAALVIGGLALSFAECPRGTNDVICNGRGECDQQSRCHCSERFLGPACEVRAVHGMLESRSHFLTQLVLHPLPAARVPHGKDMDSGARSGRLSGRGPHGCTARGHVLLIAGELRFCHGYLRVPGWLHRSGLRTHVLSTRHGPDDRMERRLSPLSSAAARVLWSRTLHQHVPPRK